MDGSGLDDLDAFSAGIERLVDDDELRLDLGAAGREWVRATHTPERFLSAFASLADPLDG